MWPTCITLWSSVERTASVVQVTPPLLSANKAQQQAMLAKQKAAEAERGSVGQWTVLQQSPRLGWAEAEAQP